MPKDKSKIKNQKSKIEKNAEEKVDVKPMEKHQQIFKGRIVSVKAAKTATVLIESRKTHRLYKKSYAQSKKFLVHDEIGVKMGDIVEIVKCRPISKNKHFQIIKVVGRDMEAIVTEKINEDVKRAIEEVIPVEQKISESEDQHVGEAEKLENLPAEKPTHRKDDKLKKESKK